jgi:hypothetical protein
MDSLSRQTRLPSIKFRSLFVVLSNNRRPFFWNVLGMNIEGAHLRLAPRFPKNWTAYKVHYRYRQTVYHIIISQLAADVAGANQIFLDGHELATATVPLVDDRSEHFVEFRFRPSLTTPIENRPAVPALV